MRVLCDSERRVVGVLRSALLVCDGACCVASCRAVSCVVLGGVNHQAELASQETARMETLLETGRQRLEGLIEAAITGDGGSGGGSGSLDGGADLTRLWQEGKEQLAELAGKGGEVRAFGAFGAFGAFRVFRTLSFPLGVTLTLTLTPSVHLWTKREFAFTCV